jgi:hypothetical protein
MTPKIKIVLITAGVLLVSTTAVFAFRKKKPVAKAIKKVGSIIWPEGADSSEPTTETGDTTIKLGSTGRYVEQLQNALNDIHKAALYMNKNCNMDKWATYPGPAVSSQGDILNVSGTFDANTQAATKFYLYRTEVDLDYLAMIKKKIDKQKANNDVCVYPLGEIL